MTTSRGGAKEGQDAKKTFSVLLAAGVSSSCAAVAWGIYDPVQQEKTTQYDEEMQHVPCGIPRGTRAIPPNLFSSTFL